MSEISRILIVDDERLNVDLLEQELELLGYETISAANGREALQQVEQESPDLILLDVMMPIMDGFTVCRLLKDNPETRLTPIIIMTALDGFEDRIKGIEAGADDFLTKPINDRELRARIQTALKMKQAMDEKLGEVTRIKDHFAKFVPSTVKRLVAANPQDPQLAKQDQEVSVLFIDVSGYTRLCELLPPDLLNAMIEKYFSTYLDCIQGNGGDISETAGDGLMAIFQASHCADHASVAVETGLELLAVTDRLNMESNSHPLGIHMGLSSGTALVGSTRIEGRLGERWVFTASGTVTNLAARLAGVAEAGQVLIGPETEGQLNARYQLKGLGSLHLKNIAEPVEAFRVIGRAETH